MTQIFISWSGDESREVAETLSSFVRHVVRGVEAFVSTRDIDAGDRWEERVMLELERSVHAILCVTQDNQASPWLNYEAGAMSKSVGRARVIPYAIGFSPSEIVAGPLSRFQGVQNDAGGTWSLVRSLNRALAMPNDEAFVREDFELWWPRLQEKMAAASTSHSAVEQPAIATDRELLLEMRRDLQQIVAHMHLSADWAGPTPPDALEAGKYDSLTSLFNRNAFMQRAEELESLGLGLVVACIDIDDLKRANDEFGHAYGDDLIHHVAALLQVQLHHVHTLARMGGDEFMALFAGLPVSEIAAMLTEFIRALPKQLIELELPPLTVSVGLSSAGQQTIDDKIREADLAMYQAKKEGKACVREYDKARR